MYKAVGPGGPGLNLQALISHYCGNPLRGNKNKTKTKQTKRNKSTLTAIFAVAEKHPSNASATIATFYI